MVLALVATKDTGESCATGLAAKGVSILCVTGRLDDVRKAVKKDFVVTDVNS